MEVLRKSREAVKYSALTVILALGAGACASSGDGESGNQSSTPTTTIPDYVGVNEFVGVPLSDDWEVSDVQYLGRTEYFDDETDWTESDQFIVIYGNSDRQDLECLYVRPISTNGGPSVSCNWQGYNDSRPAG